MNIPENIVSDKIRLKAKDHNTVLFRNNVALLYSKDGRPVKTGLCNGSSDLIGFKKIKITPDMIGQEVAIFTAVEVKKSSFKFTPSSINSETVKGQTRFIEAVKKAGGIAGFCRSNEEFEELVK